MKTKNYPIKYCLICHKAFKPRSGAQKYCTECVGKRISEYKRNYIKRQQKALKNFSYQELYNLGMKMSNSKPLKICKKCGAGFEPVGKQRICKACKKLGCKNNNDFISFKVKKLSFYFLIVMLFLDLLVNFASILFYRATIAL